MACRTVFNYPFIDSEPVYDCSQASYLDLSITNCDDKQLYPRTCDELWNNSLCENDKKFFMPICNSLTGNLLYFQYQFFVPLADRPDGWRLSELQPEYYLSVNILDECCEPLEGVDVYAAIYAANTFRVDDRHFQTLVIDTDQLPPDLEIFYIQVETTDGKSAFSHAFKRDCCNSIVKFEGQYTQFGCNGAYYAEPETVDTGTAIQYKNIFTTYATVLNDNYTIEKTVNRNNVLAVKREEILQVKIIELSLQGFKDLVETLSAKTVLVTASNLVETEYNFAGTIGGLLGESRMYKPDITLTKIDCEQNLKC